MTEDALNQFLQAWPGRMSCLACLGRRFEASVDEIRAVARRLRMVEAYRVEAGVCDECAQMRVVFGFRPGADRAMNGASGEPLCPVCLGPIRQADKAFRFHDQLIHHACDRSRQAAGPSDRPPG
jgi:hypothetical protein